MFGLKLSPCRIAVLAFLRFTIHVDDKQFRKPGNDGPVGTITGLVPIPDLRGIIRCIFQAMLGKLPNRMFGLGWAIGLST
jgi:hypothetical protein